MALASSLCRLKGLCQSASGSLGCPPAEEAKAVLCLQGGDALASSVVDGCLRDLFLGSFRRSVVVCGWAAAVLRGAGGGPCPALLLVVESC